MERGDEAAVRRFVPREVKGRPRRVYLAVLCVLLLVTGVLLRGAGGIPVVFTALIYAQVQRIEYPGTRTPEDTVVTFYLAMDKGDYGNTYGVMLEPDWSAGKGPASFREAVERGRGAPPGWTAKEEFLQRMEKEVGEGGTGVTLGNVEARILKEIDSRVYADIPGAERVRKAFTIEASGNILGACSIFVWRKELVVLQVGRQYRLLLSGTKNRNELYYQSWFSEFEQVGTVRGWGGSGRVE
jgi:hypothetical protein